MQKPMNVGMMKRQKANTSTEIGKWICTLDKKKCGQRIARLLR